MAEGSAAKPFEKSQVNFKVDTVRRERGSPRRELRKGSHDPKKTERRTATFKENVSSLTLKNQKKS